MHKPIPQTKLTSLGLHHRKDMGEFIDAPEQASGHPYAGILRDVLRSEVAGVLCVGGVPSAAVMYLPQLEENEQKRLEVQQRLADIHKMLWNQGTIDYLLVIRQQTLALYSLWVSPEKVDSNNFTPPHARQKLHPPSLIDDFDLLAKANALEEIITGVESGRYFAKHKNMFTASSRIDAILVNDLIAIRDRLQSKKDDSCAISSLHEALLQVIFLRYLWDRGILTETYLLEYGDKTSRTLEDLLSTSLTGFARLLSQLDHDLNGSLFTPDNPFWKKGRELLAYFLEGMTTFGKASGHDQRRLFPLYQFQHIPVELLSEIYDRFLDEEGDRREGGVFYTPRRLAALVIDQVWEHIKIILEQGRFPLILDPACGSGVFLVTLFQRIAEHRQIEDWDDLKHIACNLHGIDISETAVRITTFSLSLKKNRGKIGDRPRFFQLKND